MTDLMGRPIGEVEALALRLAQEIRRCIVARQIDDVAITVWRWEDAPDDLRYLSNHGGDEDWVAVVPADMACPNWICEGGPFGCCSVSEHNLVDGETVYIGAHA